MQRDPDLYRRTEVGWFLGALTFATTVAAVLPVDWWLKLVIAVLLAFAVLPALGWLSGPLGRTLRFLLDPVEPLSSRPAAPARMGIASGTAVTYDARAVAANYGVDPKDPLASRVLVRQLKGGELHPLTIWPADIDPVPKMHDARRAMASDRVYELVAMRGYKRVGRWRAPWRARMVRSWAMAADPG